MELARRLLSNLFPSRCILCRQTIMYHALNQNIEICSDCYQALAHNVNCCKACALPLPEDVASDVLCGRCMQKQPVFDYCYSLFRYEEQVIKLIHDLKFGDKISYARSIGELLLSTYSDTLLPTWGRPKCIIPVPLHGRRLRKRGYNQSTEIARVITKKTGIPIEQSVMVRHRGTLTQAGLKAKDRQKNIRGAFKAIAALEADHVLIVDDVITTGSTISELTKVLKKYGVKRVGVMSIARAPLNN